jgi:transposase-like protein
VKTISFKRHRFTPAVITQAVWPYFRLTLSLRDVEDLLAERGIDVTYETIRCWVDRFGPAIAANIRKSRQRPDGVWHVDEMVVRIGSKRMFIWRPVDKEGEVLDVLMQKRRNKAAALKLLRKLLKNSGSMPEQIVTDGLASYKAAIRELGCPGAASTRPITRQQSRGKLASPGAATRAKDAAIQVPRPGSAVRLNAQRDLQCFQRPASPRLPKDNAKEPKDRHRAVECRVRGCELRFGIPELMRPAGVNLTTPS